MKRQWNGSGTLTIFVGCSLKALGVCFVPNDGSFSAVADKGFMGSQAFVRWSGFMRVMKISLCFLLIVFAPEGRADYLPFNGAEVAPNIAEIRIGLEGVSIQFEVFVEDLPKFETLIPDDWFIDTSADRPDQSARLAEFAETGLSIRRNDGRALPVSIITAEPRVRIDRTTQLSGLVNPLTGRKFPAPPADPRVLFVELFYTFGTDRPDAVTISPPMTDQSIPAATIGMIVFDRQVPVTNFSFLSAPAKLKIDWNDPWYSRFDTPTLKRHHLSGVTTFIYVEPRQVRHETLIRLRDLDPWLELDLSSGDTLTPDEQARIKTRASEFLPTRNPVRIDGFGVEPERIRIELLRLDPSGLQVLEGNGPISADASFLGAILSFPVSDLPNTVDVTWDMFNERIVEVPATATDMAGPFMSGASPEDPLIVWNNHLITYENPQVQRVPVMGTLAIPVLSVLGVLLSASAAFAALRVSGMARVAVGSIAAIMLGAAVLTFETMKVSVRNPFEITPPESEAHKAVADLLAAIRIAHLETSPEARAMKINAVATDASLDDVSAELDRALAIRVQGGGLARMIKLGEVALTDIQPTSEGYGFRALAEWSAIASAEHWGHRHVRDVYYRALIEVLVDEGYWKLDGITILEARTPNA